MCVFLKRNCLVPQQFLPLTQSLLPFVARSYGDLSSWYWNPGVGGWCGSGTPHSSDITAEFLFTTCGCGASPFYICAPPTSLDGCGFFNSVVVRLPFNLISECLEWWLFYILVLILMQLCKEASHICLCRHLDQKSPIIESYDECKIFFLETAKLAFLPTV